MMQAKTDELSVDMLLNVYKQIQADYNKNLSSGFREQAKMDLTKMSEINTKLMDLLKTTRSDVYNVYETGIKNQATVTKNNPHLVEIAKQLKANENEIIGARNEMRDANITSINSTKQRVSNMYKYIALLILSVITIALTVRAYTTDDTNSTETVILVLALALFGYHIVNTYVTPILM